MKLRRVRYGALAVLTVGAMLAVASGAAMAQNSPSSGGYAENCGDTGPDNAGMSGGCGDTAWNGNGIGAATAANTAHPMGAATIGDGNIDLYSQNCGDTGQDNAGNTSGCGDTSWNGNGIAAGSAANTAHPMGAAPVGNGNIDMYSQNCGDTGPDNGGMTSGCGDTTMNGNGLDSGAIGSASK